MEGGRPWRLRKQMPSTHPTRAGAGCGRQIWHPRSTHYEQAGPGLSQGTVSLIYGLRTGTTGPFHWEGN